MPSFATFSVFATLAFSAFSAAAPALPIPAVPIPAVDVPVVAADVEVAAGPVVAGAGVVARTDSGTGLGDVIVDTTGQLTSVLGQLQTANGSDAIAPLVNEVMTILQGTLSTVQSLDPTTLLTQAGQTISVGDAISLVGGLASSVLEVLNVVSVNNPGETVQNLVKTVVTLVGTLLSTVLPVVGGLLGGVVMPLVLSTGALDIISSLGLGSAFGGLGIAGL